MNHAARFTLTALVIVVALGIVGVSVETQDRGRGPVRLSASSVRDLREWDGRIGRMERDGELRLRKEQADTLVTGRTFRRFDQYYKGIAVWGGEAVVETNGAVTVTVLTNLYEGIDTAAEPAISPAAAKRRIESLGGAALGPSRVPALVVFPTDSGQYRLAYTERVATLNDVRRYFIDAGSGELLHDSSELMRQSAVGSGTGVLGDTKKVSTTLAGSVYVTDDGMRPPALHTYDLKGNASKLTDWLNGVGYLYTSDMASDADNLWTDTAVVDAHAQTGWVYDYFFKRFGRRSFDDNDSRVLVITHPVNRSDLSSYLSRGLFNEVADYYVNAFYAGGRSGIIVFGEGLPPGLTYYGQTYNYIAGSLDIVAHEYAHGVIDFSSRLGSTGEPKSLNEGFSDMIGTSVDYYIRPGRANYTIAEEVISGGIRSIANPSAFGGVDHYSKRKPAGYEYENSGIPSHAFYLAIEGGTNRTSGMAVQGVGPANREQIEKSFYRGFTSLTSQATFSMARSRTIESARAIYGSGSPAERAITQAWDAVGVF